VSLNSGLGYLRLQITLSVHNKHSVCTEKNVPAEYRRVKNSKFGYGLFLKLWFRLNLFLVLTVIPVTLIYVNGDPTIHIAELMFQALPIIPYAFNSVSRILLPLIMLLTRYMELVAFGYEALRMYCLGILIMLISYSQLHDAFDFQAEFFKMSRSNMRQISLAYVLKYRQILMVRDTFNPTLSLGQSGFLLFIIALTLSLNYSIVKMYADLSTVAFVTFISFILVALFLLKAVMKETAAIEQASVDLLRSFQVETRRLHGKDLRYVSMALKSLPPCSLYIGLPGFNILKFGHSMTTSTFLFVLDNTINLLLTF
jgi:hypothetical protein